MKQKFTDKHGEADSVQNLSDPLNMNAYKAISKCLDSITDQRQINEEIQRFESVHPCIYRIYDLIEKIENKHVGDLIRQQVINIEDAFVNSQEWTLGRGIKGIKLVLFIATFIYCLIKLFRVLSALKAVAKIR
jgi:hypothetical protein